MSTALAEHVAREAAHQAEASGLERRAASFSVVNVVLFTASVVLIGTAAWRGPAWLAWVGATVFVGFLVSYVRHGAVLRARDRALVRAGIHALHQKRAKGDLAGVDGAADALPADHPYAGDLDVLGEQSLFARLDVTHTMAGKSTLVRWLLAPSDESAIRERQEAVLELAADLALREDLEAAVLETGKERLDGSRFLELVEQPPEVVGQAGWVVVTIGLPILTLVLVALSGGVLPSYSWAPTFVAQMLIAGRFERHAARAQGLLLSRLRFVESYRTLFAVIEGMTPKAKRLVALKGLLVEGGSATRELARLEMWASFFALRTQGLVHLVLNPLLLWDVNVLRHVESWCRGPGKRCEGWFDAAGELEALASLSVLAHQDPAATLPELTGSGAGFVADGLVHPLIGPAHRVANDVRIERPGCALLITGSNMAGKSTLLRAVGLNTVLALAGGVVTARQLRLEPVRLRASMRVADSLQRGASYFQAELARLRVVVDAAEAQPPVLVLLDELLRGTNAKARHVGARAVVLHLLGRGAMGLVATHDIALSELEAELTAPGGPRVRNVHFTDVFANGEMVFDYTLREGVVRTSNALRLLAMAGIEVEADDSLS